MMDFEILMRYFLYALLILISSFAILDYIDYKLYVPYYSKKKREKFGKIMEDYFSKERGFLEKIEEERIRMLMEQMGLSEKWSKELHDQILRWRFFVPRKLEGCKEFLKNEIIKPSILIDQKGKKTIYAELSYFVNLRDICFIPSEKTFRDRLSEMIILLIKKSLKTQWKDINKIIIPRRGNFPLGAKVAKDLSTSYIKMRADYFILEDQNWEGTLSPKNTAIIVHDVTVKAEQLCEDLEKLEPLIKRGLKILGIFTVIERKDKEYKPRENLKKFDINLYSILEIDDNVIGKMLG